MVSRIGNARLFLGGIILSSFLWIAPALPQPATLGGNVSNTQNGAQLHGAAIHLHDIGEGRVIIATTDSAGAFRFDNLASGYYSLSISLDGYAQERTERLYIGSGQEKSLAIALVPLELVLGPVVVTASRRVERASGSAAAVTVVESRDAARTVGFTAADHLGSVPAIEYARIGVNTINIALRGFNDIFPQSVLLLTDHRNAQMPTFRGNMYQLLQATDDDIDRIEVAAGPASALYGPNTDQGIVHVLTKSPFESVGTTLSIGGGERSSKLGSVRHAGLVNSNVAFKVSARYYTAREWEMIDPAEPATITKGWQSASGRIAVGDPILNRRDYAVNNLSTDLRLDLRANEGTTIVLSGGLNKFDGIGYSPVGATQLVGWTSTYFQSRLIHGDLFAQVYANAAHAGSSFALRSGDLFVQDSKVYGAQVRHELHLNSWQRFTYGLDALLTRPETGGTVNGRNEGNDGTDEVGTYLQSESRLLSSLILVNALRFDYHNRTADNVLSPRSALIFKPRENHALRLSYNRAFRSPANNTLFLDLLVHSVAAPPPLSPVIGPTISSIRAAGTMPSGFTFSYGGDGLPEMVSLYGRMLAGMGVISSSNSYLAPTTNSVWPALRQLAIGSARPEDRPRLDEVLPQQLSELVPGRFAVPNPTTGTFDMVDPKGVRDVSITRPTISHTLEFGYRGLVKGKLLLTLNAYRSTYRDFVSPLAVVTPYVLLDPARFVSALTGDIAAAGMSHDSAFAIAAGIAQSLGQLPIGLISPKEVQNPTDVILTYRNFGEVSLSGFDVGIRYAINPQWMLDASYAFLGKNMFSRTVNQPYNIPVNAPQNKFGLGIAYHHPAWKLDSEIRFRFIDRFPFQSGVYIGEVPSYHVVDASVSYELPLFIQSRTTLSVRNLFDRRHVSMLGVPETGRLALMRITVVL